MLFWTSKRDNYYIIVRHCIVIKTGKTERNALKTLHIFIVIRRKKIPAIFSIPWAVAHTRRRVRVAWSAVMAIREFRSWNETFSTECAGPEGIAIIWTKHLIIVHRHIFDGKSYTVTRGSIPFAHECVLLANIRAVIRIVWEMSIKLWRV